jgi:hypothetical protein
MVRGRIQDKDGGMSSYGRSVTIQNVAPTATFNKPLAVDEGSPINLSLTAIREPSLKDLQAGLQMAFKCGNSPTASYEPFGSSNSSSCTTSDNGTVPVGAKIKDKDNGLTEYPLDNPGNGSVTVNNVAPTAELNVPQSVNQRQAITVLFTNQFDPSSADTTAGFTYAFDCGSGYGPEVADSVASCVAGTGPSQTIRGKIIDKDGGVTERTRTVTINDVTNPRVKSMAPKGSDVSAKATVTFSEAMNKTSVVASKSGKPTTFFLKTGRTTIAATVKYVETATGQYKAVMTLTSPLRPGVTYTATITSAAKDLAGNALVAKSWQFTVK